MLTGSSALHHEGTKQITTPKIKATLKDNYWAVGTSTVIGFDRPGATFYLRSGVVFNNKIIITFAGSSPNYINSYSLDGASLITENKLPSGVFAPLAFHVNGNTLTSYTTDGVRVFRNYSNDGSTWLFSGNGQTLFVDYPRYIAPIGDTLLYLLGSEGNTTYYDGEQRNAYSIKTARFKNSSWGVTLMKLYNEPIGFMSSEGELNVFDKPAALPIIFANQITFGNDRILFKTGDRQADGLRILESDGLNIFGDRKLINVSSSNYTKRIINMYGLAKSNNTYYTAFRYTDRYPSFSMGTSVDKSLTSRTMVMWSKDMLNWTNPVSLPVSHQTAIIFPGESFPASPEYVVVGTSHGDQLNMWSVFKNSSELDISANIVNYSNQNNERITITLGNYK